MCIRKHLLMKYVNSVNSKGKDKVVYHLLWINLKLSNPLSFHFSFFHSLY